jgi:hypothetical protein
VIAIDGKASRRSADKRKGNTARPAQPPNPFRLPRLLRRSVTCRAAISATAICAANSVRERFLDFGAPAAGWSSKCGELSHGQPSASAARCRSPRPRDAAQASQPTGPPPCSSCQRASSFASRLRWRRAGSASSTSTGFWARRDPWRIKDDTSASRNLPAWQVNLPRLEEIVFSQSGQTLFTAARSKSPGGRRRLQTVAQRGLITVLHPFNIALATRDRGMITQARIDEELELIVRSA